VEGGDGKDPHLILALDNNDDKTMRNLLLAFNKCECEFRVARFGFV